MAYLVQLLFLLSVTSLGIQASDSAPFNGPALREAFLKEHRVFEKIVEGKSNWSGTFCNGNYHYRIMLKTTVDDLNIEVNEDGSLMMRAVVGNPYVGFQGAYQGAYSFCYPIENWSGLGFDKASLEARISFSEAEEGRVHLKVEITSVELGTLVTGGVLSKELEDAVTRSLNQGLSQVWSSELGSWLSQTISYYLNENLPIKL